MKLYGIPNCNTVKKARAWLDEHDVAYEFHDYKKQGVDQDRLARWLSQASWEKLLNRAGTTWRNLDDHEKAAVTDTESAVALMLARPSIIKRPVLEHDGRIVAIGFQPETYQTLF